MDKPEEVNHGKTGQTTTITVKAVPVSAWTRAKEAAARNDETMGEWLARAINQLADREAGGRLFAPGQTAPDAPPPPTPAEIEGMMRAAAEVSKAAAVPVPKTAARHFFALLTAVGRQARGLPAVKPRSLTGRRIGQTLDAKAIEAPPG